MKRLIVMSFDGEYKTEGKDFPTTEAAWDRSNDMGSRWYFYPFHFITTETGKTVVDAPEILSWAIGRRVKTVQRMFAAHAIKPEAQSMDCEEFALTL